MLCLGMFTFQKNFVIRSTNLKRKQAKQHDKAKAKRHLSILYFRNATNLKILIELFVIYTEINAKVQVKSLGKFSAKIVKFGLQLYSKH